MSDTTKLGKKDQGAILDEFCRICNYNRKYAIRLLHAANAGTKELSSVRRRGRRPKYRHPDVIAFLKRLWIASNLACSKRLKAMIPLWLPHDTSNVCVQAQALLGRISPATIDRLLKPLRKHSTKPGSLLKKHVPIKTNQWDERIPGFLEADTVAHCGTSVAGMFIYTVNTVDIATGWNEARAVWGKGEQGVLTVLKSVEAALPFRLRGFDCDNGTEFLNWVILKHFQHRKRPVQYTRIREYNKNDNAHIEGKNWTLIRQYFGYDRFENQRMVALMNDLYANEWRLLINFFLPSMKLQSKHRVKSKTLKRYDSPQTPFQRLRASKNLPPKTQRQLLQIFKNLNPFVLQRIVSQKISAILRYATPTKTQLRSSA
ncbi:MAG: integrase [Bacteroidota bacterium]